MSIGLIELAIPRVNVLCAIGPSDFDFGGCLSVAEDESGRILRQVAIAGLEFSPWTCTLRVTEPDRSPESVRVLLGAD